MKKPTQIPHKSIKAFFEEEQWSDFERLYCLGIETKTELRAFLAGKVPLTLETACGFHEAVGGFEPEDWVKLDQEYRQWLEFERQNKGLDSV